MPADFPNNPTAGETFTGTNGATYTWDGVKWVNTGCGTGALDNLVAGTCISLPKNGNQVTVNASVPCIQTPWLQTENAGGFQLMNASFVQTPALSAPPTNALTLSGSGDIKFNVDSSTPMLMTTTNVGIGTQTPQYSLDVHGTIQSVQSNPGSIGGVLILNNVAGAAEDYSQIMYQSAGIDRAWIRSTAHGADGYQGTIEFWTGLGGSPNPMTEKMRISGIGHVGINTSNPHVLLELQGLASDPASTPTAWNEEFAIIAGPGPGNAQVLGFGTQTTAPYGAWIQVTHSGKGGQTYPLVLNPNGVNTASGNVGIGTPTPRGVLDVNGPGSGPGSYLYYGGNANSSLPAVNAAGGVAIGWNYTGGNAEVDFFNMYPGGQGFRFYQMTGASSATYLAGIDQNGNFFADRVECASAYFGPAAANSAPIFFGANSDPGAGMPLQTICIWADESNGRLVLEFKNNGGGIYRGYVSVTTP